MQMQEQHKNEEKNSPTGVEVAAARGDIHVLPIIGQIEGHYVLPENQKATKYEQILPRLVDLEQDENVRGVLFILHTLGGDVEAGLAMAEMIASMRTPTVSLVLGGGHSIGVPLAVAAKTSFIVPSASMTVHPVRTNGLTIHAPQTYDYFQQMQERIVRFVCGHSHISPQRLTALMLSPDEMSTDIGTVLDGERAVAEGLIDCIGTLHDALCCLCENAEKSGKQEEKIEKKD